MSQDTRLQVAVGGATIQCRSVEDQLRLEPIGGILADGSTEGYGLEELDKMVEIFARYDQPESLGNLKRLVERRRQAEAKRG